MVPPRSRGDRREGGDGMAREPLLGVIVGSITDQYAAEITRGVEEYGTRHGYLTIVGNSDREVATEAAYVRLLQAHGAAGLVLVGGMIDDSPDLATLQDELQKAEAAGMVIVAVGPRPRLSGLPYIGVDDRAMLRDLAAHLIQQGHRNLVWVGPVEGFSTGDLRFAGVLDAFAELQLVPPVALRTGIDFHAGRRAALQMLQSPLPDAVIAVSDECALGVLTTLRSVGVNVPDQVAIAGVDGTRESEFAGLTTMAVPMYELGAAAAARIVEGRGPRPMRSLVSHQLMPGMTTAIRKTGVLPVG